MNGNGCSLVLPIARLPRGLLLVDEPLLIFERLEWMSSMMIQVRLSSILNGHLAPTTIEKRIMMMMRIMTNLKMEMR